MTGTANDTHKFAQTYRESDSGLDYAQNRYFASSTGRFLTADPYRASSGTSNPQSWNHYAYAQNDPINFADPVGLLLCVPGVTCPPGYPGGGSGSGSGGAGPGDPCTYASIGCGDGGEGGGEGDDPTAAAIAQGEQRAYDLLKNPKCAGLFKLPQGVTPQAFLQSMYDSGAIQAVDFATIPLPPKTPGASTFATQTAAATPMQPPLGSPVPPEILLNTNATMNSPDAGGYFGVGLLTFSVGNVPVALAGADKQALILIHELGHLANNVFGAGSSSIGPDGTIVRNGIAASVQNSINVYQNCLQ
jgi:RHS repeat-associated protein